VREYQRVNYEVRDHVPKKLLKNIIPQGKRKQN